MIKTGSVAYDPTNDTVTLTLKRPLRLTSALQLVVAGTGSSGLLDSRRTLYRRRGQRPGRQRRRDRDHTKGCRKLLEAGLRAHLDNQKHLDSRTPISLSTDSNLTEKGQASFGLSTTAPRGGCPSFGSRPVLNPGNPSRTGELAPISGRTPTNSWFLGVRSLDRPLPVVHRASVTSGCSKALPTTDH